MPDDSKTAPPVAGRLSRWSRVAVMALASLALAFGVLLMINSQTQISNVHARNFHNVEVLAHRLETWPADVALQAKTNLIGSRLAAQDGVRGVNAEEKADGWTDAALFDHPDLGRYKILYMPDCARETNRLSAQRPIKTAFAPDRRAGQRASVVVTGLILNQNPKFVSEAGTAYGPKTAVCFGVSVPSDRLVPLERAAPLFSHFMIVGADGAIIQQLGASKLPIAKMTAFAPGGALARRIVETLTGASGGREPGEMSIDAIRGSAIITVAGTEYIAYVKPVAVSGEDEACRSMPKEGGEAKSSPGQCYAVGLMPTSTLRRTWLRPPPLVLAGFGLAFLIVIALLPLVQLLLIGGTESIGLFEVVAVVLGIHVAAAMATLAVIFAVDVVVERRAADDEAHALAVAMAADAGVEVRSVLDGVARDTAKAVLPRSGPAVFPAPYRSEPPHGLPPVESIAFFDRSGRPADGARLLTYRNNMTSYADVSARDYFNDVWQGNTLVQPGAGTAGARYAIGQVRTQTDGLNKSIFAIYRERAPAGLVEPGKTVTGDGVIIAPSEISTFLAPVLPGAQRFMVVDRGNPRHPVLFHSERDRAGVDRFDGPVDEWASRFTRDYDGRRTRFAAVAVPGTRWSVLVFHALDDVDAPAAQMARQAGVECVVIAALCLALIALAARLLRIDAWRLWPNEAAGRHYRNWTSRRVILGLFAGLAVVFLISLVWSTIAAVAVAAAAGVAVILHCTRRLASEPLNGKPLTPQNERHFRRLMALSLLCAAAAPMAFASLDSLRYSSQRLDDLHAKGANAAIAARRDQTSDILRSFGLLTPAVEPRLACDARPFDETTCASCTFGARAPRPTVVGLFKQLQSGSDPARPLERTSAEPPTHGSAFLRALASPPAWPWLAGVLIVCGGLIAVFWAAIRWGLDALAGFGIPMGAVTWPRLDTDAHGSLKLNKKTLLVGPQQIVRDRLSRDPSIMPFDLADALLALGPGQSAERLHQDKIATWRITRPDISPRLMIGGLELVLRDPERRRAALRILELAAQSVERGGVAGLVVIVEMSPLERILDAFESERRDDMATVQTREELRWARLFQDFTTYTFAPIDKISDQRLDRVLARSAMPRNRDVRDAIRTLVTELRWVRGAVIDGAIGDHSSLGRFGKIRGPFPLAAKYYQAHYTRRVAKWAVDIAPPSTPAAIDFLRSNMIEHYEQCWASSTFAERLVLDVIARRAFVNMRHAIALQSLVRRGLVIFDPAPRLMNKSFALFVRQAERPDTLQSWRKDQPQSSWSKASMPIFLALPLLLVGLAAAAAESGQSLAGIIPLLAAGAPAVLSTLSRLLRPHV